MDEHLLIVWFLSKALSECVVVYISYMSYIKNHIEYEMWLKSLFKRKKLKHFYSSTIYCFKFFMNAHSNDHLLFHIVLIFINMLIRTRTFKLKSWCVGNFFFNIFICDMKSCGLHHMRVMLYKYIIHRWRYGTIIINIFPHTIKIKIAISWVLKGV